MPADLSPLTCPDCAGLLSAPPLERCTEPENHDQPPGKGQWAPHVAEAVTAIEPDEDEDEEDESAKDDQS